jgi:error-prone DNA polymerase
LEEAGLVKIDLLGLRMLSAIATSVEIVTRQTGTAPDLESLSPDDPSVYAMLTAADTVGVFQVESRAQAQVLPRLRPQVFDDLIVSISLIRPGPIQGHMVHPYLRRRLGKEPVTYPHPLLEPALAETLGIILFQEQVLKVARDLGRFTPGQGELLRRALGGKVATEQVERFHAAFLQGAAENQVAPQVAEGVFAQLKAFGGYSFPRSHAAAFAVLVYQSAWLKRYHPQAFYTALLNHQPMGFWSPAVIVNDARRHGISVLPVDIQHSLADCTVEGQAIRLGLRYVARLGERHIAALLAAREQGTFSDLADFCKRVRLPFKIFESLIAIGALDGLGESCRQLLWALGEIHGVDHPLKLPIEPYTPDLPPFSSAEAQRAEYLTLGLSTGEHPLAVYRPTLTAQGILDSQALARCPDGALVRVAGLVVVHQAPPTAKGFHFVTLENEAALLNVIVNPGVYAAYRTILRTAPLLLVEGRVQHREDTLNVLARRIMPLR